MASSRGFIYKVNIPDDPQDPYTEFTDCVINTDFTDPNGQSIPLDRRWRPIYASPTVAVEVGMDANGEIDPLVRLFVGTGDNPNQADDIEDAMTQNLFFAYVDETSKGDCNRDDQRLDWFVELPENHRITTSAFLSAGRIFFGTATSDSADHCVGHVSPDADQGDLYVYNLEGTEILSGGVGDIRIDPLVTDEQLYLMLPSGLRSLGSGIYNNRLKSFSEPVVAVRSWEIVD